MPSGSKNNALTQPDLHEAEFYDMIFELAQILGNESNFGEIIRLICSKTAAFYNCDLVSIVMINPKTQKTIKTIFREEKQHSIGKKQYHLVQTNVIGWMMKKQCSFSSMNIQKDSRFQRNLFKDIPGLSVIGSPLINEKSTIGYFILMSLAGEYVFTEKDHDLLEKLSVIIAPFLGNNQRIESYFKSVLPDEVLLKKYETMGLIGGSSVFKELLRAIEAAANNTVRVILEGESGTGKELIAHAIHQLSGRNDKPFIALDCGAIPENLIESELFGHTKGAFTGATYARKGLFQEADNGTLFLDEISNLPLEMQSKLLRVLQEGEIRVVGSNKPVKVDVRIIAASSPSLKKMVSHQKFREDLFYRLYIYPILVPSLQERKEDIPFLADYFLKKMAEKHAKDIKHLHGNMLKFIKEHPWKGNIRELENFIERLITLTPEGYQTVDESVLPSEFKAEFNQMLNQKMKTKKVVSLADKLNAVEIDLIKDALEKNNWNQSRAARALKISERVIRYKMEKYNIKKE